VRAARAAALLALIAVLGVAGCGRKGPPVVPRVPQGVTPQALQLQARGEVLELSWRYPAQALQPEIFRVLRARVDTACPDCPLNFREVGSLGALAKGEYLFQDEGLTPGAAYAYRVVPVFARGVEGPASEPLEVTWRAAEPPAGLVAAGIEGGVRLFWEPRPGALGYFVYRAEGAGQFVRLGEVKVPPYLDAAAQPGRTYRYAVATVGRTGEGPLTAPVEATVPQQ
jgi:predicted small lipoprotein YifL